MNIQNNVLTSIILSLILICTLISTTVYANEAVNKEYEAFNVTIVGNGQPVLLLPGVSSSGSVWDQTVQSLKQDYQLHVFNLAGFAGVPAAPMNKIGRSYLAYQKQAITEYIAQNNLKGVVVIGHSLGGFLSLWIATDAPQNVRGVINVDGLPALGALIASMQTNDQNQQAPKGFDPVAMVKRMANNADWHQRILQDMSTSDQMTSGRAMGELMSMDIRPQLSNIKVPTLTLGAPAQGLPYSSYEQSKSNYEQQFANAQDAYHQFAFAKTSKHFIMADEPVWMNQQIRNFLQQL